MDASITKRASACLLIALVMTAQLGGQTVNNYVVGAQDVLLVTVLEQPDLGGKFSVEADGSFTFPYIGRVKAGGQTLRQVEEYIRKELSNGYFRNPQVSVAVESYRSQQVIVVGEVRSPGPYPLTGDMTLMEAIARAGYTTERAGSEVLVLRPKRGANGSGAGDSDDVEVLTFDIRDLQNGRLQSVQLQDRDTINVPRTQLVYVDGQVKTPGAYAFQKGSTVRQVITLAGGITDRGSTGRIRIVRVVKGKRSELKAELDDPVLADDTVNVGERFF